MPICHDWRGSRYDMAALPGGTLAGHAPGEFQQLGAVMNLPGVGGSR